MLIRDQPKMCCNSLKTPFKYFLVDYRHVWQLCAGLRSAVCMLALLPVTFFKSRAPSSFLNLLASVKGETKETLLRRGSCALSSPPPQTCKHLSSISERGRNRGESGCRRGETKSRQGGEEAAGVEGGSVEIRAGSETDRSERGE